MAEGSIDVLVIGAGPAGCAAAITAARGGARVLVLDRARFPRPKTCGDAVSNRGARLVDRLCDRAGALTTIPHAVVEGAVAILPDGARIARSFGHDPGYIVPRLHLDDLLRRALEGAGVELRQEVRVRQLLVEGGRTVGAAADREQWRAPLTIAADGPGSLAWTALGQPYNRGRELAVAITGYYEGVDFADAPGLSEHYFETWLPCGYGWAFPPVEGLANVGVYQRADHFHRSRDKLPALLDRFVAAHPRRFSAATRQGPARVWSLPLAIHGGPPVGPGLLTCGDAGRLIDPLAGEGIWQALHSGTLAGTHALRALDGADEKAARDYRRACVRSIVAPSLLRLGVQESMRLLIASGGYRRGAFRSLLRWGYGSDALEVSKGTDRGTAA